MAAFEAAYQTRALLPLDRNFYLLVPTKALLLGIVAFTWVLLGRWLEIYHRLDSALPGVILRDTFKQCFAGTVVVVLVEFLMRLDLSRVFLALFFFFSLLLLSAFRLHAGKMIGFIRREFGAPHYVVVVGGGERAQKMGQLLERSADFGVRLAGFVDEEAALDELPAMLRKRVIDEVIFVVDSGRLAQLEEVFVLCDEEGVRTRVAVDFFPHINSEIYLDRLGSAPLLTFAAAPHDEILLFLKRTTDIVLSTAALLILAPFLLLIAAIIRLTSRGPAIFRQVRCGLNGRRFVCYKFRSMVKNAEALRADLEHLNEKPGAFKIARDPRLTGVGRWLRKFSLDELPQLWNVFKGDMSLVGPRPAVPEEVDQYLGWQRRRLRMRPGLTCLWALNGRDHLDFESWMRMDMQYIDSWSLGLDWKIMLRTVPQVLSGKGAN